MLNSTVLEVAIGLGFCYASLALIVSTLQEALAALFGMRANLLRATIGRMLADPRAQGLAGAVYAHPLVRVPLTPSSRGGWPSYIEPIHFAQALRDSLRRGATLEQDIAAIGDAQLRQTLATLLAHSGADEARFQQALAAWFTHTMARLSGVYKRRQWLISFLLALLLAILFNIDSVHLFRTLWQHPALAAHIQAVPAGIDPQLVAQLRMLPIGWIDFPPRLDVQFALQVAGWLITASTTLFGAPFWFDILQRLINLRSSTKPGQQPAAASPAQAPAARRA